MLAKKKKPIESYSHTDKERVNNPPVGLVSAESDPDLPKKNYEHLKVGTHTHTHTHTHIHTYTIFK